MRGEEGDSGVLGGAVVRVVEVSCSVVMREDAEDAVKALVFVLLDRGCCCIWWLSRENGWDLGLC